MWQTNVKPPLLYAHQLVTARKHHVHVCISELCMASILMRIDLVYADTVLL